MVNIRSAAEGARGESLVAEVGRIRKNAAVFDDVLGLRGNKLPVTAVVANLALRDNAGTKKALARVRRAMGVRS